MRLIICSLFISFFVATPHLWSQNKIGENASSISPGSLLELESLTKGLRLPRIPLNDVNLWTLDGTVPASGMLIFNEMGTAPKGMYYWNSNLNQWSRVASAQELASLITGVSNSVTNNKLVTTLNGIGISSTGVDIISANNLTLSSSGILTSAVNGVTSSPGLQIINTASNGLTATGGNVQLGGSLTKPTTITTSGTNTLGIKGLSTGDLTADQIVVIDPTTGVIHQISPSVLVKVYTSTQIATINGQTQFLTPATISKAEKIQVYRNGMNIGFNQVAGQNQTIEIELDNTVSGCFKGDEIKIVQTQ